MGTISPWASKATDIARNCGLDVFRVERITEYRISLKSGLLGGTPELSSEQLGQIAALLHDRMTESVFATRAEAEKLFTTLAAQPMGLWMCWAVVALRWKLPTSSGAWRWQTTRSNTWSMPSTVWGATLRT